MINLPIFDDFREVLPEHDCAYLAGREAQFDYRVIYDLTAEQYDHLLARGWRRHGLHVFRPVCESCSECQSLRVPVQRFTISKSQRRTMRRNANLTVSVRSPSISSEHINVFNRYHADMAKRRNWRLHSTDPEDYYESFLCGRYEFEREFLYFDGDKLVGVGIVDIIERSASSIYFFHDPDYRDNALGVYSMVTELLYLKQLGVQNHYLGYWIEPCPSMAYKNRYRPHEILSEYVADIEEPVWLESGV